MSDSDITDLSAQQAHLENLVDAVLVEARKQGATAAEAAVRTEAGFSVTARLGEVETVEHHRDRGIGVTVYFGQRKGSASSSDLRIESLSETVKAACGIARYTEEDEYAGLADASLMAKQILDLDLNHAWNIDTTRAIDIAVETETVARDADKRITNSEGATVSTHQAMKVYANSHGFVGGFPSSSHNVTCVVIGEQDGDMQRDYWYSSARDADDMESHIDIGKKAADRTVARLGARQVPTCHTPVIFSSEVASGLLGSFISAISGGSQYRKSSFLLDCVGDKVFPDFVRIHEQPHLCKAVSSAPFDSEGVATRPRDFVSDGVVRSFVLGSYSARKLGLATTGNAGGVRNLTIDPGEYDLNGLLKQMGTGLLVTELMGHGVNGVTGDYSRGASGFWVEGGELAFPVHEITVAGNLKSIFRDIQQVGSDVDVNRSVRTGSVLVSNLAVAGS